MRKQDKGTGTSRKLLRPPKRACLISTLIILIWLRRRCRWFRSMRTIFPNRSPVDGTNLSLCWRVLLLCGKHLEFPGLIRFLLRHCPDVRLLRMRSLAGRICNKYSALRIRNPCWLFANRKFSATVSIWTLWLLGKGIPLSHWRNWKNRYLNF